MWYFSATLLVMSGSSCFPSGLVSRSRTSSIHSRHAILVSVLGILIPRSVPWISLFISSIGNAYWSTERTPPCLMLSLILIFLVGPYFVWMVAVKFSFSFLLVDHIFVSSPLFFYITYIFASIHALLKALVASSKVAYTCFLCDLAMFIASFGVRRWSVVALPLMPPA